MVAKTPECGSCSTAGDVARAGVTTTWRERVDPERAQKRPQLGVDSRGPSSVDGRGWPWKARRLATNAPAWRPLLQWKAATGVGL